MSQQVTRGRVTLSATCGRTLAGVWWDGADARERSVVFLPGLGAPQVYLRFLAGYLARHGYGVLTFDYRGVGASRAGPRDEAATLDDWLGLDLPAAVAFVQARSRPRFLAAFAHSIGGQLLGQSPAAPSFDAAVLLAAQRGMPRLYRGASWLRVRYAYTAFPLLIRALGRLPVSARYTFPQPCPAGAVLQWVRWGRTGVFRDGAGRDLGARFAEQKLPIVAVGIADDHDYAPGPAVDALARLYAGARVTRRTLAPEDYGLDALGHFGFFSPRAPRALWDEAIDWLRQLEAAARGATRAPSAEDACPPTESC